MPQPNVTLALFLAGHHRRADCLPR